jgi:hypothetical protein
VARWPFPKQIASQPRGSTKKNPRRSKPSCYTRRARSRDRFPEIFSIAFGTGSCVLGPYRTPVHGTYKSALYMFLATCCALLGSFSPSVSRWFASEHFYLPHRMQGGAQRRRSAQLINVFPLRRATTAMLLACYPGREAHPKHTLTHTPVHAGRVHSVAFVINNVSI